MMNMPMDPSPPPFKLKDEAAQTPSDWQISDLYSRAWKIVKKNKTLWIFGAALAALEFGSGNSGGSGGSGGSGNSDTPGKEQLDSTKEVFNFFSPDSSDHQTIGQVLGDSTDYIQTTLGILFREIPVWMYLVIALEIIFMFVLFMIIRTIYKSWVEASLLAGTQKAADDQSPTIESSSNSAFPVLKSFIWLDIVPGLIIILALFLSIALVALGIAFGNLAIKIISGLAGLIGIFVFIYAFILLTVSMIWAKRQVVFEKKSARIALSNGYKIAKKKYWTSILLGFVNNFLAGIIVIVPFIILIVIFLIGIAVGVGSNDTSVWITLGSLGGILLLGVIIAFTLLSGVISAFKATVWTLAYGKIKGKYDES